MKTLLLLTGLMLTALCGAQRELPLVIGDFEASDYGAWKVEGTAFGVRPAAGKIGDQMPVEGFRGRGLANSYQGGDAAAGKITSPPFTIRRKFIAFLIGGGGWPGETCINLLVNGRIARTATGRNTLPGGSERLAAAAWDVGGLVGHEAIIEIVDRRKGEWGHINVDDIVQSDDREDVPIYTPPAQFARDVSREMVARKKWLLFPVRNGAPGSAVTVHAGGVVVRRFGIELAEAKPDWWAPLDVSAWAGKKISVSASVLPVGSKALESLRQSDRPTDDKNLYREALRPQLHFSPKRGWMNDPNGLCFYNGEYHLFFQHNPYGVKWDNMHWGHATSRDLVHWTERGEALYPDELGAMFSGSAVVDGRNSSGFGRDGEPPLILLYTAAGNPTTQCLAYSGDGRTFTKFAGNPVIKQIAPDNRDPKVFWHEPSGKWVMALYAALPNRDKPDAKGDPTPMHTVHFLTSPNLRDWRPASVAAGGTGGDDFLFECPDFFELPVNGDPSKKKWVLIGATNSYDIGAFDGATFTPETGTIPGVPGGTFYAAQTFSDLPDGRRIQMGWCRASSPGMPFNQSQSLPMELALRQTPDGIRLFRNPVKELEALRDGPDQADSRASFRAELIELRADFAPGDAEIIEFTVRGAKIVYDAKHQEIVVNGLRAPAPLMEGKQRLTVFVDRTMLEVFASDGLTYLPAPFLPKKNDQSVAVTVTGGAAKRMTLQLFKLKSIW